MFIKQLKKNQQLCQQLNRLPIVCEFTVSPKFVFRDRQIIGAQFSELEKVSIQSSHRNIAIRLIIKIRPYRKWHLL